MEKRTSSGINNSRMSTVQVYERNSSVNPKTHKIFPEKMIYDDWVEFSRLYLPSITKV